MPRRNRRTKEGRGEQPRSNEEERKPTPYGGRSVGGAALSPGVSRDDTTTDFQKQGVHGGLQKEGTQSDKRPEHCTSSKSCPDRTGRAAQQLGKEKNTQQHKDEASVTQTGKVSTLQKEKGESNERSSFETPTKEDRPKEHDGGGISQGQDEGASQQNECSSQQHNEPKTEDEWRTVQNKKSHRYLKRDSTRESSPYRNHRPLPGADNTRPPFRNCRRPYQPPSFQPNKKQGKEPTTRSEMDTEDQQRVSEIKELIKRLDVDRKDTHCQTSKDAIVSKIFEQLAEEDFPRAFKEAYCVPPYVDLALTTHPVQGRAFRRQDSDAEGMHAECLVSRTFKALNVSFAKKDQPAMFIMRKFCLDNLLGWLGPRGRAKLGDDFARLCTQIFGEDICNQKDNERREADLIVLHPDKGIVFVEVKAVGGKMESMNEGTIWMKIKAALKGLDTDTIILTDVLKRSPHRLLMKMQRVVALPNVTRQQLQQVTESKSKEIKGVNFLCKEELLIADDTKPDVENNLSRFREWWHKLPSLQRGKDSSGLKEIIGKYVGPLSLPVNPRDGNQLHQLRHISDCVRHAVRQREKLICDTQNELLEKTTKSRLVYVEGPTDRRSTSLLITKARRFLQENDRHRVVVLSSLCEEVRQAASRSLSSLIRCGHDRSRVVHVEVNTDRVKSADEVVTHIEPCLEPTLRWRVRDETVLFVVDEIQPKSLRSLVLDGLKRIRKCKVWMACQASEAPEGFEKCCIDFTNCCSPSILQLVKHVNKLGEKKPICHEKVTYFSDLSPLCIRHEKHDPKDKVTDCELCARELAEFLKAQRLLASGPRERAPQGCLSAVSSPCHELRPRPHSRANGGARINKYGDAARREAPPSSDKTLIDGHRQRPAPEAQPAATCPSSSNIVLTVMFNRPVNHRDSDDSEYMDTCPFIKALQKEQVDVHVTRDLSRHDSDVAARGMLVSCVDNFEGMEEAVVVFVPSERAVSQGAEQQESTVNTKSSAPTVASMEWESADIRRFHSWDRTNMALAGSRCFGLFILIVP